MEGVTEGFSQSQPNAHASTSTSGSISESPDSPISYLDPPSPIDLTYSPSASTFLRTAATLDGLAKQLDQIKDEGEGEGEIAMTCCCGATLGTGSRGGCAMIRDKERMEDKLKLSGEIGNALLQRYEALERKLQREVKKYEHQLEVKRTALADSVKRMHNLEKANHTHLQKYAEMSKKTEALEKRYTQAMHTQTLTQQSLTHVRTELTSLRATTARQNIALASGAGVEERLADVEKRYEDARELAESETRKVRDEGRKRKRAEARIAELEGQLGLAMKEVESIKEARAKDAQDLLTNAKDRLAILHTELSDTFRADSPSEMPEYQRALESLVANNALLKHDATELSHSLSESRDEVRTLREELDELRATIGGAGRRSPMGYLPHLASELSTNQSLHSRTESSPVINWGHGGDRTGWQRMSMASSSRTGGTSAWEHHRKTSMAPSFTSASTMDGVTSPGLGMGPIGEFGGILSTEEKEGARAGALSPPLGEGRDSPKQMYRTSPSGGIGYVLNGVPKIRPGHVRPSMGRSFSENKRGMRSFASQTVGSIAEWSGPESEGGNMLTEEPISPGNDYFRAAEASRKRRSLMIARRSTMSPNESAEYSPNASNTLVDQSITADYPSPMSDSALPRNSPKRAKRKTLLLLTRSTGVQTDPVEREDSKEFDVRIGKSELGASMAGGSQVGSTGTSPVPPTEDRSETSSIQESRASVLLVLIEHLSRILAKLRSADVPTLNKRLKKQHLPGDVSHLSETTMRALQQEVADFRHLFRGAQNLGGIDRKDFNLLLRLFKDVFGDLVELQAVVNDVTITPSVAKKLQRAAFKDEEDEAAKQASGLGWIAAPITKFFVTPAAEGHDAGHGTSDHQPKATRGVGLERGRLHPMPSKSAPKQTAVASATATHVSVEFGGQGIVRRATPASTSATTATTASSNDSGAAEGLPSSPGPSMMGESTRTVSSASATVVGSESGLAPPAVRTLRPSKSRSNRNELLGIFAGAAPRAGTSNNVNESSQGQKPLRSVSSRYFADKTIRGPRDATQDRKRLPAAVDAVIDVSAEQLAEEEDGIAIAGSYDPPLLERTLRPRGLSDSSIRSTFVSQSAMAPVDTSSSGGGGPTTRAQGYGASVMGGAGGGMLQSLSRRIYGFRGTTVSNEVSPVNPEGSVSSSIAERVVLPPTNEVAPSTSPPRAIPRYSESSSSIRSESVSTTNSATRRSGAISPPANVPSSATQQTGLLGMLASSIIGASGTEEREDRWEDGGQEENLNGAGYRRGRAQSSWR
ncbi:hypothetical protein CI109_100538 [Kwoniella shandongensis]|uniref:Uncharacterized protein n=1 Tax=Kwoniella shandongensis TaxID=1734106 RepID=A0A5M6C311_9TREE|nr:uncharacterized protein CI109_003541 [Kwoniella shandongensis]KAA5528252.1 hypothetical protein CI109_003541 [Kwoniella shandongensis]